jgi:hypothetical protein
LRLPLCVRLAIGAVIDRPQAPSHRNPVLRSPPAQWGFTKNKIGSNF